MYIAFLGICAFLAQRADVEFRGSSQNAKMILTIGAGLGFVSFVTLFIASFFFAPWWHILLLCIVVTPIVAGIIQGLVSNLVVKVIVEFLSCVGVIVFSVLAWTAML